MRKTITIGDLGTIITGKTPPTTNKNYYGDYAVFIKPTDISEQSKYTYETEEMYSKLAAEKYESSLIPKGAICVPCIGTIGTKMTMAPCDCYTNQSINSIVCNENYDNEYVYYLIKNFLPGLKAYNLGTASGREYVSKSNFEKIELVAEQDKTIQKRIGVILSRYDSLIENYQKQIKLLEEAAQRLYKEWFVDLHFPGHENIKIIDGVPEGWEKKKIEEFAAIKSGFAFKSKDWQGFGCPVVKIKDINGTFVLSGSLDCVPIFVAEKANQYILRTGDLVIAMTGATIGKIGIVTEDDLYANQRVGKFFVKDRFILPFLFCYFKEKSTIDLVLKISSSSAAQPNISSSQLGSFDFMYNKELFDKFCDIVQNPFHKIILLQNQIRLLTEARDRLLPKLISGLIIENS